MKFFALNLLVENDWVTIVLLFIIALLGFVKYTYKGRLVDLSVVFLTKRYFLLYGKESQQGLNRFNVILFLVQTLVLSLFVFLAIQFYKPNLIEPNGFINFIKSCSWIALFFLIKFLAGYALAVLFEMTKQYNQIVFAKRTYLFSLSILSFPMLIIIIYVKNYNLLLFQLSILLIGTLLIMRYLFVLKSNKSVISRGLFYFILYLCALEIAPLVFVFKMVD